MDARLQVELWTSWASMLRVYSAAHGLTSVHHAVVEVGAEEILLRVDTRWTRFTLHDRSGSDGSCVTFSLHEDGTVTIGDQTEEMDMAAERVTRELLAGSLSPRD